MVNRQLSSFPYSVVQQDTSQESTVFEPKPLKSYNFIEFYEKNYKNTNAKRMNHCFIKTRLIIRKTR